MIANAAEPSRILIGPLPSLPPSTTEVAFWSAEVSKTQRPQHPDETTPDIIILSKGWKSRLWKVKECVCVKLEVGPNLVWNWDDLSSQVRRWEGGVGAAYLTTTVHASNSNNKSSPSSLFFAQTCAIERA